MCAVVSILYLHLGQAGDSCCLVCIIFFLVVQNPVKIFDVHRFELLSYLPLLTCMWEGEKEVVLQDVCQLWQ